tara:strand:- start:88 stop:477 length:390 start_codon:yes stop_codon:yes gene_type:complete
MPGRGPVEEPELQRFGDMFAFDTVRIFKICDRSGQAQDAMIGPGGKTQRFHRLGQKLPSLYRYRTNLFQPINGYPGIEHAASIDLSGTRSFNPLTNSVTALAWEGPWPKICYFNRGDPDLKIDTIQKRA